MGSPPDRPRELQSFGGLTFLKRASRPCFCKKHPCSAVLIGHGALDLCSTALRHRLVDGGDRYRRGIVADADRAVFDQPNAERTGFEALSRIGFELPTIPLLKPIAAGPDEQVCFLGDRFQLGNGRTIPLGDPHWRGTELPLWPGCRILQPGEYFVYGERIPNSLDSRHFGPVTDAMVIGSYTLIWTW